MSGRMPWWLVLLLALVLGGAAWWVTGQVLARAPLPQPGSSAVGDPGTASASATSPAPAPPLAATSATVAAPAWPADPPRLPGFARQKPAERLSAIARLQRQSRLDGETLAFLRVLLQDRRLDPTTRNLVANVFMIQEERDGELWQLFATMAQDGQEGAVWREYAIQHLASCADFTADPAPIIAALLACADERGDSRQGTALLHLQRLLQDGRPVPADELRERVLVCLQDPGTEAKSRITAACLAGDLGLAEALPTLRAATGATTPISLRRAVLAALGGVGEASDLALLEAAAVEKEPAIAGVAQHAILRLRERLSATKAAIP